VSISFNLLFRDYLKLYYPFFLPFKKVLIVVAIFVVFDASTTAFFFTHGLSSQEGNRFIYPGLYDKYGNIAPLTYIPVEFLINIGLFLFLAIPVGYIWTHVEDWNDEPNFYNYIFPLMIDVALLLIITLPLNAGLGWWAFYSTHPWVPTPP
jgi:hypothetical protein